MDEFVLRRDPNGGGELLIFTNHHLLPIAPGPEPCLEVGLRPDWGRESAGALYTAEIMAERCGCPADLLGDVAALLAVEFVAQLPRGPVVIPLWQVQQQVVVIAVRVMADQN